MNQSVTKICVIGLGYIGLPTAAMFASKGIAVQGVDINETAVETINRGEIHIVEPELDTIVRNAVADGFLRAGTRPEPADAFLIAVPTPFKGDHEPDLSYVEAAVRSIAPSLTRGNLVVLESTSPVGTTEWISEILALERPDLKFPHLSSAADVKIAYCPERVLPGRIVKELVSNDRVIGGITPRCSEHASNLYGIFVEGNCIKTNARSAEMCKLTENSFRDVNIAFANELSVICSELRIDVFELISLANRHPRVKILQPGVGVGGHCIAVDPWFLVHRSPGHTRLIKTARAVNDEKPRWVVDQVRKVIDDDSKKIVNIVCFGLTYKPDIDDVRESPALEVVRELAKEFPGRVHTVDSNVDSEEATRLTSVGHLTMAQAAEVGGLAVLLVPHTEFKEKSADYWHYFKLLDPAGVMKCSS